MVSVQLRAILVITTFVNLTYWLEPFFLPVKASVTVWAFIDVANADNNTQIKAVYKYFFIFKLFLLVILGKQLHCDRLWLGKHIQHLTSYILLSHDLHLSISQSLRKLNKSFNCEGNVQNKRRFYGKCCCSQ